MNATFLLAGLLLIAAETKVAESPAVKPPVAAQNSGATLSTGQRGGVTAGSVGTVNQYTLPLVQGPLLEKFKSYWTAGARIRSANANADTDDAVITTTTAANSWAQEVYNWLNQSVGPYAAERFAFRTNMSTMFTGESKLSADSQQNRNNVNNAMTGWLQNLDMLMRDPGIYPPSQ